MNKNHSTFDKTQVGETQLDNPETFLPFQKSHQKHKTIDQNKKKEENKNSMEIFCYQFYKDFFQKSNQIITVKELTQKYGIKNRRVYELMSILEGFSYVHKMKKVGHYMWQGAQSKQCIFHFQQNRSVALKDVAGLLKLLLTKYRQGLSVAQLNEKIMCEIEDKTKLKQSKLTINRRIYQCLKVMKIIGMVQKQNNNFKLIKCRSMKTFKSQQTITVSHKESNKS